MSLGTPSPEAVAHAFLDHLSSGEYASAFKLFDRQMKVAMPELVLRRLWEDQTTKIGRMTRRGTGHRAPQLPFAGVAVDCEFERGVYASHFSIKDGRIMGVSFGHAVEAAVR